MNNSNLFHDIKECSCLIKNKKKADSDTPYR